MKILSEKPLNMHQLKEELDKIKKRDKELNFSANKTEEYISQFASTKNYDKLADKITKLNIPRLRDQHIAKIIDIMPTTIDDLKVILQGYTVTLNQDSIKKIITTITEFLAENK